MTIRHCPHCRRHSLVHTGGFWACETCGYAVTQTALLFEYRGSLESDTEALRTVSPRILPS
jgi:ribosomal protein L37AE/L43A